MNSASPIRRPPMPSAVPGPASPTCCACWTCTRKCGVRSAVASWKWAMRVPSPAWEDPDIRRLQEELSERLGAAVRIQHGIRGSGKLVIQYASLDELDGILERMR